MRTLASVSLVLVIAGGLNWLLVGLFRFDLVAALFGGPDALLARIVYVLVGLATIWMIFRLPAVIDALSGPTD